MPPQILHLSSVVKSPLVDRAGDRLGRVEDVIVRLGGAAAHPPVTGLVANLGGRQLFVPINAVSSMEPGRLSLKGEKLDLGRFERREGELLLARDLATRHFINWVGARLIRAHEIELACVDGNWEVVGIDPRRRTLLRRLLPGKRPASGTENIIDWSSIEPFFSHVPSARLRIPYRKLSKLHPAQIADLVEAASHDEGEEIIEALGENRELEADVFEELDSDHQKEFIEGRSDSDAARLLASMAADDAADLIAELDQDRRLPLLEALPPDQQRKVRSLLSYHPETAGGLMSPDFLCLSEDIPVARALDTIRASDVPPEALGVIYACDNQARLTGTASVVRLLQADPKATLIDIYQGEPKVLLAGADMHEVMRTMADFNLTVAPVVDDDMRMIGVVTVDDLLELYMPSGWRKDFGMTAAAE